MKDQCKCGGNLERIAETQLGISGGYMARKSAFSECAGCKKLYETAQKTIFAKTMSSMDSTFQYGGNLTRDEIKKHAHFSKGYISSEDEKEIIGIYRK